MTMTETMKTAPQDAPRRRQWGTALKALRRLLSDKEDTGQVFEIMRALNGDTTVKNYRRLLETQTGGRLAYERVELAPLLMDPAWLDGFADGTVGSAYRRSAVNANPGSGTNIPTPGSGDACATRTTSGTFSRAIIATAWAKPAWSRFPTRRRAALVGR